MNPIFLLALLLFVFGLVDKSEAQNLEFVVAGFDSDNVVAFDISSGQSQEIIDFGDRFAPRGIAANDIGEVFVGLRLGGRNVIKLVNDGNGGLAWRTFNAHGSIGTFGPGKIKFGPNGNLYVAAGSDGAIKEFDGITGNQVSVFNVPGSGAIQGLAISGTDLYASEYFQNKIQLFDLSQSPVTGMVHIDDSVNLDHLPGLDVGPGNVLTVVNSFHALIQQYDEDGSFRGTLFDLSSVGETEGWDVVYEDQTQTYLVTSRSDSVYQISPQGTLLNTFSSPVLAGAYGIAVINVVPIEVPVGLFDVANGTLVAGNIEDLIESDNSDISIQRNAADIQSRIVVEFEGTSPTDSPSSFSIRFEASVFARSAIQQSIDLYDYDSSTWLEVSTSIGSQMFDSVVTAEATGDLSRFVEDLNGSIKARCRFSSPNQRQSFAANIDHVAWLIVPPGE